MKKLMLTALLFPGLPLCIFAGPAVTAAATDKTPADTIPLITTTLVPARPPVTIRITNNDRSQNLSNTILEWELLANGITRQKGRVSQLFIAPQHTGLVRLPVRILPDSSGELFLQVRYRSRNRQPLRGKLIAQQRLLLVPWGTRPLSIPPTGELSFTDEDGIFTIHSPGIRIRFDKQTGWLLQYEVKGFRLLEDSLPTPPAQESPWQQPAHPPRLQLFSTSTGSEIVIVRTEYDIPETFFHLHLAYSINASGEMLVERSIEADSTQKGSPLPHFGMRWPLPPGLDSITGYGPLPDIYSAPPDTYSPLPDIYRQAIREGTPPSATDIRCWTITGKDGKGLLITADSSLLKMSALSTTGPSTLLNIDYPSLSPLPYGSYHYSFKVSPVIP